MGDSEKNGGHLLLIPVPPTLVPSYPQASAPLARLPPQSPSFPMALPTLLIPCWVLLPAVNSRSICPFQPQNDRQNILFLMKLLPRERYGVEMECKGEVTPKDWRLHHHLFLPGLSSFFPAPKVSVSLTSPPVPLP